MLCKVNSVQCGNIKRKIKVVLWQYINPTPPGTKVTPSRLQIDDLCPKRLEATWAKTNRLSTSSRLLTWHSVVYLRLLRYRREVLWLALGLV